MDAVDIYGLSEVMGPGVAGESHETKDGNHIWEDHFRPEIIDPFDHTTVLPDGHKGELVFTSLTKDAIRALEAASAPMGFNLGMNQGAVAGAGVAAHLHQHVVPRWGGDANFLPIIARTKALPVLLEDTRARLVEHWPTT